MALARRPLAARRLLLACWAPLLVLAPLGVEAGDVLEPRLEQDKSFSETFTLLADLEGGVYLQLQLGVSNIGLSNGKGACRILLVEPGQAPFTDSSEVGKSGWSYEAGELPLLRVGHCTLAAGKPTRLRVEFDRTAVSLDLDASIDTVRPLDRRVEVGDSFYESDVLIPWAAASATIERAGAPARTLSGHGYGDHSRSTTLPGQLASRWVRFRGLAESGSMLVLARFPSGGGRVDGWLWRQGEPAPVAMSTMQLVTPEMNGGHWHVRARDAAGAVYEISTEREIYRYAPMEQRGLLGNMLKGVIGNPVTYSYRAVLRRVGDDGEVNMTLAALPGIAEVTIVDE